MASEGPWAFERDAWCKPSTMEVTEASDSPCLCCGARRDLVVFYGRAWQAAGDAPASFFGFCERCVRAMGVAFEGEQPASCARGCQRGWRVTSEAVTCLGCGDALAIRHAGPRAG